ncbi:MAG: hypothetical protein OXL39_01020 [Caldilineaceae bacterium]|nr:hypothetical protein [Caldilineaceae bacterium]
MTLRILGCALFALLLAAACIPQSLPSDSSSASIPPPPTLTAQASASAQIPTPQSVETPTTVQPADAPAIPSGECVVFGAPPPTLPDTDCRAWDMLHSLVIMTNMMVNENEPLAAPELLALETELTPRYVQANLNCGEWVEPLDYEPLTDYIGMLSYFGIEHYGYDPPSLLCHLINEAAAEEFVQRVESIGCVKGLLMLFVEYTE